MHSESSMPERSDAELVAASIGRDPRAFEILLRRRIDRVRQVLAGLSAPDRVDDMVQEACLIAWQRLASIEQPASFGSWLCGIGIRLAWQDRRSKHNRPTHGAVSLEPGADPEIEAERTPYSELALRTRRDRLLRAIQSLPRDNAEAVTLYHLELRSYREIAERLGLPVTTVQKRVLRGRKQLEKALAPMRGQLGALGGLGAAASPHRHAARDALVDAVMRGVRGVRGRARPSVRHGRDAAGVALVARLLPRRRAALVATAAAAIWLAPAVGRALALVRAAHDLIAPPDAETSPSTLHRAASPATPPSPVPRLPAPPVLPELPDPAAPPARAAGTPPDYVVTSASTEPGSALFGVHDLSPMDAYGTQLYQAVSSVFARDLAWCLRDLVGPSDRSQIAVDLRFTLWRDPARPMPAWRARPVADYRDVTYGVSGCKVPPIYRDRFERCITQAFDRTDFPAPDDGRPRDILHHIAVDFGAVQDSVDAICAAVP